MTNSPRVSDLTGTSARERRGAGWLDVVHPQDRAAAAAAWALAVLTGLPYDHTFRVQGALGIARRIGCGCVAARGAAITGPMLSLARRAGLRAGPIDVAALLTDLQVVLAATLGGGVKVRAAEGLPPVLADRGRLETVLINLATNARDAMPRGGTLRLSATLSNGQVQIMAEDNGAGMKPGVLARAQEPFFTNKLPGAGTGLGLAMARRFAGQSGGGLQIRSAPGQGTAVTLGLPAAIGMVAGA